MQYLNAMYDKLTAFAGKALNITGVTPLYKARTPSSRINSANTLRIPFGYVPSGADEQIEKCHIEV